MVALHMCSRIRGYPGCEFDSSCPVAPGHLFVSRRVHIVVSSIVSIQVPFDTLGYSIKVCYRHGIWIQNKKAIMSLRKILRAWHSRKKYIGADVLELLGIRPNDTNKNCYSCHLLACYSKRSLNIFLHYRPGDPK
jgi:hypothetical protein